MKKITFPLKVLMPVVTLLLSIHLNSQTTIRSQSFDSGTSDNLGYTVNNATYLQVSNATSVSSPNSLRFSNNNGSNDRSSNVTFENVDLSNYTNVTASISFKAVGLDNGEDLYLDVSYNDGANYTTTQLVDGDNSDESINWGNYDLDAESVNSNPYILNVPNVNSQIKLKVRSSNLDDNELLYIDNVIIKGTPLVSAPEIEVKGNTMTIENNAIYPSTFNHTNYGSVNIGNNSTKTYTINNLGTVALNISNISLSNNTDFQIVGTPYSAIVHVGNSTQFSIQYTGISGKHSSTVTIESDDADEGSFSFLIRASSKATGDTGLWTVTKVTDNYQLDNPYEITYSPDNYLWITERKTKKIVRVNPSGTGNTKTTMIDLSGVVYQTGGQDGLMGLAIHPDLMGNPNTSINNYVYVAYTFSSNGNDNGRKLRIARLLYNNATKTLAVDTSLDSNGKIIEIPHASNDHNSGRIKIGADLKLYYTIGDQGANQFGNACNPIEAQSLPTSPSDYNVYKGKILRLNLDGSVPSDNPTLNGVKSHVYTYGHRNPQGIIFGSNGKLYASEHGAKVDDELNIISAGKNYGWPHIAGYYDNLAYGYCNWSSKPGGCSTSGFSDHNCPEGVTPINEFDPVNASILPNFQPPIGTYNSTTDYDPSGQYLTWPTVAPSSIDIYEAGLIPNWGQSLLIPTLKEGTIFRAKLNATGDALVDITSDNKYEEFHSSNDRYRDLTINPDGITFYAITDSSGDTSGPSGTGGLPLVNPGVVIKFQYIGPAPTHVTYYVDTDEDGYGDTNDMGTSYEFDPGTGYSLNNTDCDDTDTNINPGKIEIPANNIDDDCNPSTPDGTLEINNSNLEHISMVPNPFTDNLTIHIPINFNNDTFDVKVYDLNGRLMFDKNYSNTNNRIIVFGLNKLEKAPYLLKITSKQTGQSIVKRIIKY